MEELSKPKKQEHEEWCDINADNFCDKGQLPCDCGKINSDDMYNQLQAYHDQELSKKDKRIAELEERLREAIKEKS